MKRYGFLFIIAMTGWLTMVGQQQYTVTYYDEENGLPHGHITQLLQDEQGFLWLATWNGLCRYDGYEFRTFKATLGDGCHMATDRFRDIALCPDGKMICRVDDDYYWFDTRTYRFSNMTDEEAAHAADNAQKYRQSTSLRNCPDSLRGYLANLPGSTGTFALGDGQHNLWVLGSNGVYKIHRNQQLTVRLDITPTAEVKSLFSDNKQRYWVATKPDGAVRVYHAADDRLLGFLGTDGRLHQQYTAFGAVVYCMYQTADGALWLGTKPDGIYRLRETAPNVFKIDHFNDIPDQNVYHFAADNYGRLWVAMLGGGLCYTDHPQADHPQFRVPKNYPKKEGQRVRYLHFAQDGGVLMAAATDGLIIAKTTQHADDMTFRRHQRESDRATSLSSSATMDIMRDEMGLFYISTESGGVNLIETKDLLADQLTFSHYTAANHRLPTDVVLSMMPTKQSGSMLVSSHMVVLTDSSGRYRQLDARYFNADYRFSDAHPLPLSNDRWLFGLTDGAFTTTTTDMYRQAQTPSVVLTGVSIQGGTDNWTIAHADTLTLQPDERSFTLYFAALEYVAPGRISYAFRLLENGDDDSMLWNNIGHNRSTTLLDLEPGTYRLEVRSTNSDGEWTDNTRTLTIIVKPTFWEAWYGQLFILLLVAGIVAAAIYTYLYIRRIKRKQHETLEAYLALIAAGNSQERTATDSTAAVSEQEVAAQQPPTADDPMLQRIMTFIDENLSDSDIGVGDMAAAAAVSRSGLQRKLKQAMGITPQELLSEARIKRACQLLRHTDKSVSEVAYSCGFNDPKYFSRIFKQSTGQSPSDYKHKAP